MQLRLAALQGFSKLSEPLEGVLTILEGCPGKQKGYGQTIGHHILMEFQIWWKQHPQVEKVYQPKWMCNVPKGTTTFTKRQWWKHAASAFIAWHNKRWKHADLYKLSYILTSWWSTRIATHWTSTTSEISFRSSKQYSFMLKTFPPIIIYALNPFSRSLFVSLLQVTLSSLSEQQALALQQRALTVLTDIQHNFADSFITIYHLRSMDPAILRQCIVRLQAFKCYKEVSPSFTIQSKSN